MKKILTIFICFFLVFNVKALDLNISSKNAIMINTDNNEILYEKEADEKVQIASLTKIMTSIVAIENIDDFNKQIVITKDDLKGLIEENLVTSGFTLGEIVTYDDLLYGLLLPSGADSANALAHNISKTEEEFIELMNKKAKELGLKNTHFSTHIGLDDKDNYSTVKDLSILFKYALKNEKFHQIITASEYKTTDGKLTFKSTIKSNAKKYNIDVSYILGGKTGTTTEAGLCLATIGNKNDVNYMLITTGALYDKKFPHHIEDAKTIYDYFINNYSNIKIVDKKVSFRSLKTKYSKESEINLYPEKDVIKYLPNDYNKKDVKLKYEGVSTVTPFTNKNLGKLKIYYQDKLIDTQNIKLKNKPKFSLFNTVKTYWYLSPIIILIFLNIIFGRKKTL